MPTLTEAQLVILSAAAQRDDGTALPLPGSLTMNKGAARTVLASLVKRGLLVERPAVGHGDIWRETDDGERVTLAITAAGYEAIGVASPPESVAPPIAMATPDNAPVESVPVISVRPGTKQAQLIGLLQRADGATVAEIGQATGWQPHSVRGAISGMVKKKLGLTIVSETVAGRGRVYRIGAASDGS